MANNTTRLTMAGTYSSEDEDLSAALANATAAKRKNNSVVVEPEADKDSSARAHNCLIYGHNGLIPGQWFATRASASTSGAHQKTRADVTPGLAGAYSIVVTYDEHGDLNEETDNGETILFAGTGAATWTDPEHTIENSATEALDASINSKVPVRVLRAAPEAGGKDQGEEGGGRNDGETLYPAKGLRYDGLYRVMSAMRGEINLSTNGRYDAYCLKRLPIREIDFEKRKETEKVQREYAQPRLAECVRRPVKEYGAYSEGPPKRVSN